MGRPAPNAQTLSTAFRILLLLAIASPASGQESPTRITVNAAEIAIAGRVQAQLNTSDAEGEQPAEMILRRARLGASIRVNDLVSGRVHADFAGNRVSLADAYMQLDLHPAAQLIAGRTYRPLGLIEHTSSLQILPIERGLAIRGVEDYDLYELLSGLEYGDRDIGIQVKGSIPEAPLGLSYVVGLFAGPVAGETGGEQTQQFVTRFTATPAARLKLGASWSRRDFVEEGESGTFRIEGGNAFVLDAEYGGPTPAPGFHLLAEIASGDFDPFADEDFDGGQLWAGYLFPVGERITLVEPLLRISHASIDRSDPTQLDGGTLITPGLNIYFGGLNRLMLNYDIWRAAAGTDAGSGKIQFQLAF